MKAMVFYQDFKLNSNVFEDSQVTIQFNNATFVREITSKEAAEISIVPEESLSREDMAGAIWYIMNHLDIPMGHKDRDLFKKAGHTSMSIGDFIVFEDMDVWVALPCGWKIIPRKNQKSRIPCPYPLNLFYNYLDEVPMGTRVCTEDDCDKCSLRDTCECEFCLITE